MEGNRTYNNCKIFESGSTNIEFDHIENFIVGSEGDIAEQLKSTAMKVKEVAEEKVSQQQIMETTDLEPKIDSIMEKLCQEGYVDKNKQPLVSKHLASVLANEIARVAGIKYKWKYFEKLWHRKNMKKDYYDAMGQKQTMEFLDIIKKIIE